MSPAACYPKHSQASIFRTTAQQSNPVRGREIAHGTAGGATDRGGTAGGVRSTSSASARQLSAPRLALGPLYAALAAGHARSARSASISGASLSG